MHVLLERIFDRKEFENSDGEIVKIHSETNKSQCIFLQNIIERNKFKRSIEIGFAYGTSTLAIVEAISKNEGNHTVIDPFQYKHWGGNGLDLINQAGLFEKMNFIEDFSYKALPVLMNKNNSYDFAYIDTTKIIDYLIVDFFFIDKMLANGGVIVFDDVQYPSIRKLLRLLSQFPHYHIIAQLPENKKPKYSYKLRMFLKYFPYNSFMREDLQTSDFDLGVNSRCVALRKIEADKRRWDWNVNF